jgi:hypothetical protein
MVMLTKEGTNAQQRVDCNRLDRMRMRRSVRACDAASTSQTLDCDLGTIHNNGHNCPESANYSHDHNNNYGQLSTTINNYQQLSTTMDNYQQLVPVAMALLHQRCRTAIGRELENSLLCHQQRCQFVELVE